MPICFAKLRSARKVRSEKLQKIPLQDILLQTTVKRLKQRKIKTFNQLFEKVKKRAVDSALLESLSKDFSQQIVFCEPLIPPREVVEAMLREMKMRRIGIPDLILYPLLEEGSSSIGLDGLIKAMSCYVGCIEGIRKEMIRFPTCKTEFGAKPLDSIHGVSSI